MSTRNDDDRAFFDKATLRLAPREKMGTTDFVIPMREHVSTAAESSSTWNRPESHKKTRVQSEHN